MRLEGSVSPAGTVGWHGIERNRHSASQQIAAGNSVCAPKPVTAAAWINPEISRDVLHVIYTVGIDAEKVGAILGNVDVKIVLVGAVDVKVHKGEHHVVKIRGAVGGFVFGDRIDIGVRRGWAQEDTIGALQCRAGLAGLPHSRVKRIKLIHAQIADRRRNGGRQGIERE